MILFVCTARRFPKDDRKAYRGCTARRFQGRPESPWSLRQERNRRKAMYAKSSGQSPERLRKAVFSRFRSIRSDPRAFRSPLGNLRAVQTNNIMKPLEPSGGQPSLLGFTDLRPRLPAGRGPGRPAGSRGTTPESPCASAPPPSARRPRPPCCHRSRDSTAAS